MSCLRVNYMSAETSSMQPPNAAGPAMAQAKRKLPAAVYFQGDNVARDAVEQCSHYFRASYENLADDLAAEVIVIVSDERVLREYLKELRAPKIRILAISDHRFHDPRMDAAVYAYLPANTPGALLERMVDNALDHMNLVATRNEANQRLANAVHEISELNSVGAALSAEHDAEKLLAMILTKCREITRADAGSLYLVEAQEESGSERKHLRFKLAQNDTVNIVFRETTVEIDEHSIVGYVAKHGEAVVIEDSFHLPEGTPYSINRKYDVDSGYTTKSILAVPMKNPKDEIVGVVQLLNAKRDWEAKLNSEAALEEQIIAFTERQREIVQALASQAAVAFENSQLYQTIHQRFVEFVRASAWRLSSSTTLTAKDLALK